MLNPVDYTLNGKTGPNLDFSKLNKLKSKDNNNSQENTEGYNPLIANYNQNTTWFQLMDDVIKNTKYAHL